MKSITILLSVFLLVNLVGCNKTEGNNINKTTINTQNITQNDKKANKEVANAQLIKAAQTGNLELAKQAIANGADINVKNYNDASCACTPITYAATYGHTDIVETLINAGANPNSEEYSWSALTGSLAHQHFDITKKLIKAGANVNSVDEEGVTPLMSAVYQGNIEIVKDLINAGANVNAKDEYGITALMRTENKEIQKILIENGANAKNILYFPLLTACQNENIEEISNLIKQGADVNAKNVEDGKTNLIFAVEKGNTKIAKLLLDNGADVNMADYLKNTPLNIAQKNNNTEMVELLKSYGAKENQTKDTPSAEQKELNKELIKAAQNGNIEQIKKLLPKTDVNIALQDPNYDEDYVYLTRPLLIAIRSNQTETAKLLLENGADPNLSDLDDCEESCGYIPEDKFNALGWAIKKNNTEIIDLILPKIKSKKDSLVVASCYGNNKVVKAILEEDTSTINKEEMIDETNYTPLSCALNNYPKEGNKKGREYNKSHREVVKTLITYGADINLPDPSGQDPIYYTPLQLAVLVNDSEIVKLLIENGANINGFNADKDTALSLAKENNNTEMVELLKSYGAKE